MADLHFELVTPDRLVMSDDVYMVVIPGTEGESGIMAGHAPYMTTLRNGEIAVYRSAGAQPERIPVTGGSPKSASVGSRCWRRARASLPIPRRPERARRKPGTALLTMRI